MNARRVLGLAAALVAVAAVVVPGEAQSAPTFAPADRATIHPGVLLTSPAGRCTANFVFSDGSNLFLGVAAHCVGTGEATDTNGCATRSLPLGTAITIDGAAYPGVLAYSSWATMAAIEEYNPTVCAYNDFALVHIDPRDAGRVNPSVPFWGGPTGLRAGGLEPLEPVFSYGNSPLRGGLELLSPKSGTGLGSAGGGWSHQIYTLTPGLPGDSGSAVLDGHGRAVGTLSTITILPLAGSNNLASLDFALLYMRDHAPSVAGARLVNGTVPFNGGQLPLDLAALTG